jgi:hypothetical protein
MKTLWWPGLGEKKGFVLLVLQHFVGKVNVMLNV